MDKDMIINKTESFVKNSLLNDSSSHNWFHTKRVYNLATYLCEKENADEFIVKMSALLHDIKNFKSNNKNTTIKFLNSLNLEDEYINKILNIVDTISLNSDLINSSQYSLEGKIINDANILDTMGAIGITRLFTYGGNNHKLVYNPDFKNNLQPSDNTENHNEYTINHLYKKLLELKKLINTNTGKQIAKERHRFMLIFLDEFYYEWNFYKNNNKFN